MLVERVDLRVTGLPVSWVHIEPPQLNLDQDDEKVAVLHIDAPRSPGTLAGKRAFTIAIWSITNPTVQVALDAAVSIEPFTTAQIEIDPVATRGRRTTLDTRVRNDGNTALHAELTAKDPDGRVVLYPRTQPIAVPAGEQLIIELVAVAERRLWTGPPQPHRVNVHATVDGSNVASAEAAFTQHPTLPRGVLAAAGIALAAAALITVALLH
jgi:hypothetical protein